MNPPAPDELPPPDAGYHWTTGKARVFLGALAHLGSVAEAARVVGMSRQSACRLRARLGEDNVFAKVWDKAQAEADARRRERRRSRKATDLAPESDIFGLGK